MEPKHYTDRSTRPSGDGGRISRRGLLRGAGAVAAGIALDACVSDGGDDAPTARENLQAAEDKLGTFDHVVVVMFENRSFDSVLGSLYGSPGNPDPRLNGVFVPGKPGTVSNPDLDGNDILATAATSPLSPENDPGECWPDTNVQLFGGFVPESNFGAQGCPTDDLLPGMDAPYNVPSAPASPSMQGFVADYQSDWISFPDREAPTRDQYGQIMQYFDASMLPTTHALAKAFGVFDNWFCDVPSNTFTNRSFFHAADSSGLLTEPPLVPWLTRNTARTFLNQLSDAGVSWTVYFDRAQVVPFTYIINFQALKDAIGNFAHMDTFFADVQAGTLPAYTFVEPRIATFRPKSSPENDMHPTTFFGPSNVQRADLLLGQIYDAIRRSPKRDRTLLLVTFDEHGGTHDHVPPPAATPPGDAPGQFGFRFDRLGVRIPAIAVSSFVAPGTVVSDQMQNTSVINTLRAKWQLDALTPRQESAPTFEAVLQRDRQQTSWPAMPTPDNVPDTEDVLDDDSSSVNPLGQMLVAGAEAAAALGEAVPDLADPDLAAIGSEPAGALRTRMQRAGEKLGF